MQTEHVIFNKNMLKMLIMVGVIAAVIIGYKVFLAHMQKKYMSAPQIVTVSSAKAEYQEWLPTIYAVGSIRSQFGIDLAPEVAGTLSNIYYQSGSDVEKDHTLFELNTDNERAQLASLVAKAELALSIYNRSKEQYTIKAISKAQLEADAAALTSAEADVAAQIAIITKKKIVAPFSGRLGIVTYSPGQYVSAGNIITTLQNLDPIFVDFNIPQQQLANIQLGQKVAVEVAPYAKEKFVGIITSINPKVDANTRNVLVEAKIDNAEKKLLPGMFAKLEVNIDEVKKYITLPKTAISFNSYGDLVYIVERKNIDEHGNTKLFAIQKFVTVGESRDNQVAILSGIKANDEVITSGQLKLKNGTIISINNEIMPPIDDNLKLMDE